MLILRTYPLVATILLLILTPIIFIVVNWAAIFAWLDGALQFIFDPSVRNITVVDCYSDAGCSVVYPIVFSLVMFFIVLTGFAYTTLLERKLLAWLQHRVGPNRIGPQGLLQPLADGIKLIFKEDVMPSQVDRAVYLIAPLLKTVPVLILFAVLPFGPHIIIPWFAPSLGDVWFSVPLYLANPNVGLLWLLAITSLGTYGVVLAGWASNSKYAILGGLRASAQMISYELSFGLAMVVPILLAGSLSIVDIVEHQNMIWEWYVFQNPLAAAILLIALLAETNRAPFDLPEAEQELTQGYQTEYSGMKFALFMMAEYLGMIAVSMVAAVAFFGGYNDGFGIVDTVPLLAPLVIIGKVVLLLCGMIWVRATLPRIRYDRLMQFGWKIMLPLALIAVVWSAVSIVVGETFDSPVAYGIAGGIFFIIVVGGAYLMFGRGIRGETDEDELDPIITGERQGVGYAALNVVGGILAGPFVIYDSLIKGLDKLSTLADEPPDTATTAIEEAPTEKKQAAKQSGGD
ncbi:MAG: NADH-quinone oxidoreductase subunit NuoH [Anaerolineae bacterium]|nr:NADH-quinone oxidoreductase subunit NuoH [Anaerolineae bacterium]